MIFDGLVGRVIVAMNSLHFENRESRNYKDNLTLVSTALNSSNTIVMKWKRSPHHSEQFIPILVLAVKRNQFHGSSMTYLLVIDNLLVHFCLHLTPRKEWEHAIITNWSLLLPPPPPSPLSSFPVLTLFQCPGRSYGNCVWLILCPFLIQTLSHSGNGPPTESELEPLLSSWQKGASFPLLADSNIALVVMPFEIMWEGNWSNEIL